MSQHWCSCSGVSHPAAYCLSYWDGQCDEGDVAAFSNWRFSCRAALGETVAWMLEDIQYPWTDVAVSRVDE